LHSAWCCLHRHPSYQAKVSRQRFPQSTPARYANSCAGNLATTPTYRGIMTSPVRRRQPDAAFAPVIPHESDERPSKVGNGAGEFDRLHVTSFSLDRSRFPGVGQLYLYYRIVGSGSGVSVFFPASI
jgi:hypothetical protein